mgnify:CR=1 FL=1
MVGLMVESTAICRSANFQLHVYSTVTQGMKMIAIREPYMVAEVGVEDEGEGGGEFGGTTIAVFDEKRQLP